MSDYRGFTVLYTLHACKYVCLFCYTYICETSTIVIKIFIIIYYMISRVQWTYTVIILLYIYCYTYYLVKKPRYIVSTPGDVPSNLYSYSLSV